MERKDENATGMGDQQASAPSGGRFPYPLPALISSLGYDTVGASDRNDALVTSSGSLQEIQDPTT